MNRELFTKEIQPTLEWLKAGAPKTMLDGREVTFNMGITFGRVSPQCGTACCIAGHYLGSNFESLVSRRAMDAAGPLGLTNEEADNLFYATEWLFRPDFPTLWRITPSQAVQVIEHAIETGEIDWSIIL